MRSDDAVLAKLRQRVCGSRDVTLDPPLRDPARGVGGVGVMKEIADDVSTDGVTVEQFADRLGSDSLSSYESPQWVQG